MTAVIPDVERGHGTARRVVAGDRLGETTAVAVVEILHRCGGCLDRAEAVVAGPGVFPAAVVGQAAGVLPLSAFAPTGRSAVSLRSAVVPGQKTKTTRPKQPLPWFCVVAATVPEDGVGPKQPVPRGIDVARSLPRSITQIRLTRP